MFEEAPQSTMNFTYDSLVLFGDLPTLPGTYNSSFTEDDGITKDFLKGKALTTEISLCLNENEVKILGLSEGVKFKEFKRTRLKFQLTGLENKEFISNKKSLPIKEGFVEIKNCGENFDVLLK